MVDVGLPEHASRFNHIERVFAVAGATPRRPKRTRHIPYIDVELLGASPGSKYQKQ